MPDEKVVSLRGEPIIQPGVIQPDLIGALEELLEAAKAGELAGFSAALLYKDDCTSFRINGRRNRGLLGCVEMMKFALLQEDYNNG